MVQALGIFSHHYDIYEFVVPNIDETSMHLVLDALVEFDRSNVSIQIQC